MEFILGVLVGIVFGLILHEKIFPESVTTNEITQNFKKSDLRGSTQDLKVSTPGSIQPVIKGKRFLGFLWRRKQKT